MQGRKPKERPEKKLQEKKQKEGGKKLLVKKKYVDRRSWKNKLNLHDKKNKRDLKKKNVIEALATAENRFSSDELNLAAQVDPTDQCGSSPPWTA